jgi:hypothetical protein
MQTTHTRWKTIAKAPNSLAVVPNMLDYERAYRDFTWAAAAAELACPSGPRGLNLAHPGELYRYLGRVRMAS